MLLSSFVGFLFLLSWVLDQHGNLSWDRTANALMGVMVITCFSFWVLFPILYFGYIRKSAATLEYQRLVRQGELERADRAATRDPKTAVSRDGAGPSA